MDPRTYEYEKEYETIRTAANTQGWTQRFYCIYLQTRERQWSETVTPRVDIPKTPNLLA